MTYTAAFGVQSCDGTAHSRYPPIEDVLRDYGQRGWELISLRRAFLQPNLLVADFTNEYAGPAPIHRIPPDSLTARRTPSTQPRPNDFLPCRKGPEPIRIKKRHIKTANGWAFITARGVQPWDGPPTNRYPPIEEVLREYGRQGWELTGISAVIRRPYEVTAFFMRPADDQRTRTGIGL
jgi:hypothetical protein